MEFCLPFHPFFKRLLARYNLVLVQIHPNTWRVTLNFLIKCAEVRLEPRMRAHRLVLALKSSLSNRLVVYASYGVAVSFLFALRLGRGNLGMSRGTSQD